MFKVVCGKCGKETDIQKAIWVYEWTIRITCECGNVLNDWYQDEE